MTIFDPDDLWKPLSARIDAGRAMKPLIALAATGALGIALASEIGVRNFTTEWNYVAGYAVQRTRDWRPFFVLWIAAMTLPFFHGLVGALVLPMYSRPRRWQRSIAVGVVGSLPIYVVGPALVFLPGILLVVVAFLVSCVWWASGSRELLGVHAGDSADFVAVSLIGSGALIFLLSASIPFK